MYFSCPGTSTGVLLVSSTGVASDVQGHVLVCTSDIGGHVLVCTYDVQD